MYFAPIGYCFYIISENHEIFTQFDTVYTDWVYIEVIIFVSWIIASIFFVLIAYMFKYRAEWQEMINKKSIWALKDCNDFLGYLKNEYKVVCLICVSSVEDILQFLLLLDPTYRNDYFASVNVETRIINFINRSLSFLLMHYAIRSNARGQDNCMFYTISVFRILLVIVAVALVYVNGTKMTWYGRVYFFLDIILVTLLICNDYWSQIQLTNRVERLMKKIHESN